jgi:anti-sigma factor ChrR (cupin superfamily)
MALIGTSSGLVPLEQTKQTFPRPQYGKVVARCLSPTTTTQGDLMLNMDFTKTVILDTTKMDWVPSPKAGVWRKPLAREEAERGHATSIVRYDPGASFRGHTHPLGEEILVLEGTFSDETGDFPAGTYFRNPKDFVHSPFSREGCTILVKLHQFQPDDSTRLAIDTAKGAWETKDHGIQVLPLHEFGTERVALVRLPVQAPGIPHSHPGGEEIYVISGAIEDQNGYHGAGTWLRLPPGSSHCPTAVTDALLWIKSGHLG